MAGGFTTDFFKGSNIKDLFGEAAAADEGSAAAAAPAPAAAARGTKRGKQKEGGDGSAAPSPRDEAMSAAEMDAALMRSGAVDAEDAEMMRREQRAEV